MKFFLSIIFLTLTFFLNINAQNSEEISQLKPVKKPTKAELRKIEKLVKKSGWKDIICVVGSDFEVIDLSLGVENKILSNGKRVITIKSEININSLAFKKMENGESVASINIFGKIISDDKNIDGIFEEEVNFPLTKQQLDKPESFIYQKNFELPKGKYTLKFFARDTQTGISGYRSVKFEVN